VERESGFHTGDGHPGLSCCGAKKDESDTRLRVAANNRV
jgi:hypothetical protein